MKHDSTELVTQTREIGSFDITIGIITNVACWALANVEKISSLVLSLLSIGYLVWRWRKEYLRDKKPKNV